MFIGYKKQNENLCISCLLYTSKPATTGMENRKGVILQAHMDMVPQKNNDTVHDFTKDPIETYIDGDWVKPSRFMTVQFWLMGSLAGAQWSGNFRILCVVVPCTLFFISQARILNLMLMGLSLIHI